MVIGTVAHLLKSPFFGSNHHFLLDYYQCSVHSQLPYCLLFLHPPNTSCCHPIITAQPLLNALNTSVSATSTDLADNSEYLPPTLESYSQWPDGHPHPAVRLTPQTHCILPLAAASQYNHLTLLVSMYWALLCIEIVLGTTVNSTDKKIKNSCTCAIFSFVRKVTFWWGVCITVAPRHSLGLHTELLYSFS